MTRFNSLAISLVGASLAASTTLAGCGSLVQENLLAGIQQGAVTATTGIIDSLFGQSSGMAPSDKPQGAPNQENGNDLFIRL